MKQEKYPLKILLAVHHFPPRFTGGAEWRAYRTAAALQARGHQVQVVCIERINQGEGAELTWEDDVYNGINVRRLSFNLASAPDPFRWEYNNPWIGTHLAGIMKQYQPDVFHLIGGYLISGRPLQIARRMGLATVVTLTDFWFLCRRISMLRSDNQICSPPLDAVTCTRCLGEEQRRYRIPGKFTSSLMQTFWQLQKKSIGKLEERQTFLTQTLNEVSAIISPSQYLRSVFVEAGFAPDRITFSRQGRDFPNLTPELLTKTPSNRLRVGYIGQLVWHKGTHLLFQAVQQLPNAPLTVRAYGNPTQFPEYVANLRQLALKDSRLELAGSYPRDQLAQVLRNLDVLVVPSLWGENSPNVILEAFAHHTPVIASNLGGMAELVQHEQNGLLFDLNDEASLARQLQRLITEPELLPKLRAGIKPVKSIAEEMQELETIYYQSQLVPA